MSCQDHIYRGMHPRDVSRLNTGAAAVPGDSTPRRLAAWSVVARVILNLDETITKE